MTKIQLPNLLQKFSLFLNISIILASMIIFSLESFYEVNTNSTIIKKQNCLNIYFLCILGLFNSIISLLTLFNSICIKIFYNLTTLSLLAFNFYNITKFNNPCIDNLNNKYKYILILYFTTFLTQLFDSLSYLLLYIFGDICSKKYKPYVNVYEDDDL